MSETKINRPMTLDDAITHCLQKAQACTACGEEHRQLAAWLSELKKIREEKSEANKVIEELKNEIEKQKRLRDMPIASVPNVLKVMKIIQHHKYKRCLAMADFCESQEYYCNAVGNGFWLVRGDLKTRDEYRKKASDLWWKWRIRWLDIAEKFKEAK